MTLSEDDIAACCLRAGRIRSVEPSDSVEAAALA
jgi:hypothetical protein